MPRFSTNGTVKLHHVLKHRFFFFFLFQLVIWLFFSLILTFENFLFSVWIQMGIRWLVAVTTRALTNHLSLDRLVAGVSSSFSWLCFLPVGSRSKWLLTTEKHDKHQVCVCKEEKVEKMENVSLRSYTEVGIAATATNHLPAFDFQIVRL